MRQGYYVDGKVNGILLSLLKSLEKDAADTRLLAEKRQAEVLKLTSEVQSILRHFEDSLSSLDEARRKESQLMRKVHSLKLQMES